MLSADVERGLRPLALSPPDAGAATPRQGRRCAGENPGFRGVPQTLRDADDATTEAIGLAENFASEPMHPLDEAEAFARLAREDAKGLDAIAADFGVTERYVRQRMKLATLADVVKAAYRDGGIDTGTAAAFAAVPPERQEQVWQEVGGNPQHAHHVRNIIEHGWIDAVHALFDLATLPEPAVRSGKPGWRASTRRTKKHRRGSAASSTRSTPRPNRSSRRARRLWRGGEGDRHGVPDPRPGRTGST